MHDQELFDRAALRRWWQLQDTEEQYLAAAPDLAELERRIRVLERASGGPVLVTFNH
jgi:hypothetical protein